MGVSKGGGVSIEDVYAYTGTWASRPSVSSSATGTKILVTDLGIGPVELINTGSDWCPLNGEAILYMLKLPVGIASTFTGTTNGTFTLGTALNEIMDKGYLYFPANSLNASQAAGFYYVEMTTTSAGVAYNNTYTPGTDANAVEPTSKVAFSGAVPGGTGVTSEVTCVQYTVKGSSLGLWGGIFYETQTISTNSANNKTIRLKISSSNAAAVAYNSSPSLKTEALLRNQGSESIQYCSGLIGTTGGVAQSVRTAVNTAADFTVGVSIQNATATDNSLLRSSNLGLRKWF
jgi:hypothetical protein